MLLLSLLLSVLRRRDSFQSLELDDGISPDDDLAQVLLRFLVHGVFHDDVEEGVVSPESAHDRTVPV